MLISSLETTAVARISFMTRVDRARGPAPGRVSRGELQQSPAERREALKEVFDQAHGCTRCAELAATRKKVVFGAGNADAELMFVGEAPGASEDEQGLPFVGARGQAAGEAARGDRAGAQEVFIANVLKCRPPGNRDPLPMEIENCREYLLRQVELIQPTVICTLGNFSTKLLRGDPTGITRVHGQPEVLDAGPPRGAAVSDLPPGGGAVHAAHAGDAARGLRAPAGAVGAGAPEQPARSRLPDAGGRRRDSEQRRGSARRREVPAGQALGARPARAVLEAVASCFLPGKAGI